MSYSRLFSPLALAGKRLKNRIVFPAVLSLYAREHCVTERWIDYYAERAKGGAAMLVTEGLSVHETSAPQPNVVTIYDARNDELLRRAADAVERHDCRFIGQLWHVGRQALWNPVAAPMGPSSLPDAYSWSVPHVLNRAEIAMVIDAYRDAALRLQGAGFSGVELHGAHGYLIGQFLSPWSNRREDDYGGDIGNRSRFARQIIDAIRAACASDFIVGLKMPGDEGVVGGIGPEEAARLAAQLTAGTGLDYIGFAQGNFSASLENHVPDMHFAPGPFMALQKQLRLSANGVPVLAFGRVLGAEHAEQLLRDEVGDLIGMGRALVADAALPNKAQRGEQARPCVFSNVCWGEIHAGKPMACLHNPELGQAGEAHWQPGKSNARQRVTVVGAGVAGLQAAWVLAARGHQVTLFGDHPGGKARLEATLPGRGEVAKVYEYQLTRAREHGVKFELGLHADLAVVQAQQADLVVLATGAHMRVPDSLASGALRAVSAHHYLQRADDSARHQTIVLYDQDHTAAVYALADLLATRCERLVLVTPRTQLGRSVPYVGLLGVYRRLYTTRGVLHTAQVPISYEQDVVKLRNVFNGDVSEITNVSLLVYATPRVADDALALQLSAAGLTTRMVGDCFAPRNMLAAIHEAQALASQF